MVTIVAIVVIVVTVATCVCSGVTSGSMGAKQLSAGARRCAALVVDRPLTERDEVTHGARLCCERGIDAERRWFAPRRTWAARWECIVVGDDSVTDEESSEVRARGVYTYTCCSL